MSHSNIFDEPKKNKETFALNHQYINTPDGKQTLAGFAEEFPDQYTYTETTADPVNNPSHYNSGDIECIDALEAMLTHEEFIGYLRGACFKYQWRCRYKGKTVQDLNKNTWYLNKLTEALKETE